MNILILGVATFAYSSSANEAGTDDPFNVVQRIDLTQLIWKGHLNRSELEDLLMEKCTLLDYC